MNKNALFLSLFCGGLAIGIPAASLASRLEGAAEARVTGEQYLNVSVVPMYQNALREGTDTGNYTFDVIGKFTLVDRPSDGNFGNTDLILWFNTSDKFGGLDSAPELASQSGLLWDTNDIASDSSSSTPLVLGLDQWFFEDRLSVGFGKYFPGQGFLLSPYTADNSNSFTTKMISGNPVVSWWEAIGIGMLAGYWGDEWFVQGGFVDSKAEDDLDFSSFEDGDYAYLLETSYEPQRETGETSIGVVLYYVDSTDDKDSESGIVGQFTHEWGPDEAYAAFGRYSWRDDGESRNPNDPSAEPVVDHGGFVGAAWNEPFGSRKQQLAAALVYGEPAGYKDDQGFNNQFGTEIFWAFRPNHWFTIIPNVQFMRNIDDDVETIVGLRIGLGFERNWPESSIIGP